MSRIILLSLFVIILISYQVASAATIPTPKTLTYPIIVPLLSESCQNEIKYNIPNNCPVIKDLIRLDTSIKQISGQFKQDSNGNWYRDKPQLKNHWQYYQYLKKPIICLECNIPSGVDTVKIIIMQSNNFTYIDKYQNATKNTVNIYSGRSMQGCETATIANNPGLLEDTIRYMENNCTEKTSFQGNITKSLPHFTPIDIKTVKTFQYLNVDLPAIKHIGNCIIHICNTPNVYGTKKW